MALSAFAATVVAPTKSEVEAMYAVAAGELNAGHYQETLQKLNEIDARQPDVAAVHNLRGVALMRLRDFRKAEASLRKARELDPNFWEARYNLAEVSFLSGDWMEARRRLTELLAQPNERIQGATGDLLEFKIWLTYLLEGKEKGGAPVLEKLQSASQSPALYYVKAAAALKRKDQKEAKSWIVTAGKEFSPELNELFKESFYEVGWLPKPEGELPVALELASPADRIAQAQDDLARAQRAYRQGALDEAWKLLEEIESTAPGQAVTDNLRGEILLAQGKTDEAEAALGKALEANPQLLSARYNLARVSLARKEYGDARKDLEALLGASAGGKEQVHIQRLIRYDIFLTLLLEGRDGAAQKAMDEFKMMDSSPALYYAQAAWAFQHGNPKAGQNWVANAGNLFSKELNRSYASSFAALGWLSSGHSEAQSAASPLAVAQTSASPGSVTKENETDSAENHASEQRKEAAKPTAVAVASATPMPSTAPQPVPTASVAKVATKEPSSKSEATAAKPTVAVVAATATPVPSAAPKPTPTAAKVAKKEPSPKSEATAAKSTVAVVAVTATPLPSVAPKATPTAAKVAIKEPSPKGEETAAKPTLAVVATSASPVPSAAPKPTVPRIAKKEPSPKSEATAAKPTVAVVAATATPMPSAAPKPTPTAAKVAMKEPSPKIEATAAKSTVEVVATSATPVPTVAPKPTPTVARVAKKEPSPKSEATAVKSPAAVAATSATPVARMASQPAPTASAAEITKKEPSPKSEAKPTVAVVAATATPVATLAPTATPSASAAKVAKVEEEPSPTPNEKQRTASRETATERNSAKKPAREPEKDAASPEAKPAVRTTSAGRKSAERARKIEEQVEANQARPTKALTEAERQAARLKARRQMNRKVVRFFTYPFRSHKDKTPSPSPAPTASAQPSPVATPAVRPQN
ncbi:MAG: tetratricopeptide repeat protein [Chthoniobacterales bacterium]